MTFTKDDIITTDKYLNAFNHIYYKTDCIYNHCPIQWRNKLHNPPNKNMNVIITGHSDCPVNDACVDRFTPKTWYTVNKQTMKTCVYALPLGITNFTNESPMHAIYGNLDCMLTVMHEHIEEKKNLVYMNFNISTYPQERQGVYNIFCDKNWVTLGDTINTLEGRTNFLRDIKKHDFVLCPRGNGVDTHRLWETLYMGSIPIVKRDIAFTDFEDLPICFIDEWTDIDEVFLTLEKKRIQKGVYNLEKLKIDYWISKINNINVDSNITYNMKLSTVLASTNNNPNYYKFIPKQILFWKLFNIKFIAVFVGESIPIELEMYTDNIILWDKPLNYVLHTVYIAQNIRIYYSGLLKLPDDEMVMITDMDMLPTNDKFYTEGLDAFGKKDFIYYKFIEGKQIFMCYNSAHPSVWSEVFNIKSEKDIERELINNYNKDYSGVPGSTGWYSDQELMYNKLINYSHLKILNRPYNRLLINMYDEHIKNGDENFLSLYDDCHFHRDFNRNETFILKIQEHLMKLRGQTITEKTTCIEINKVSVIIPTFNRFEYLLNAIKSVKEQTYNNIEIIVVNDCSTQKEYYEHDWLDTKIIHLSENSKSKFGFACPGGYQRNIGMKVATGQYIAFLDDDDYFLPTKIEKQLLAMDKKYNISCTEAYFGYGKYDSGNSYKPWHYNGLYWNELNNIFNRVGKIDILNRMYKDEINIWTVDDLNIHNCTCGGSSIMFDRSILDNAGYFPLLSYADDYAYWKELFKYSDCVFLREPLTYIDLKHGDGQNY